MRLLLTLILSIASTVVLAQADTTVWIDQLFSSWNNATPGGSILVARGEKILYQKAFGLANLESNVPNTINTIFEAGSVSKQFTAYSILLLESEGKLKLTDDVRKYVPELPVYEAPITIQHLLNHTSGLKDWGSVGSLTGFPRGSRDYTIPLGLHIMTKQKTTNFKPGNEYSYSNSNYTMLTVIVERVSKQTLEDFTAERIFKPLGMKNTRWRSNFRDVIPNRAQAYSKNKDVYELNMPFEHIYGHGGLLTTTSDLLKWNQQLEKHDAIYNKRIQRGKLNDGKEIAYASGIQHGEVNGVAEINHSGSTAGYRAWLAYYPSEKLTVALLSNDGGFGNFDIGRKIAEIYFGSVKPTIMSPEPVKEAEVTFDPKLYVGEYYSEDAECTFKVTANGSKLEYINDAQQTAELLPKSLNVFTSNDATFEFKNKQLFVSINRANNIPFKKIR
ncbi:MAG: serine hydrolase domain-containing protein [Bacteroidota bacterium]